MKSYFTPVGRSVHRGAKLLVGLLAASCLIKTSVAGLKYSQIVVFGDSLSDVANFADTTQASYGFRYPGTAFNYATGRFTDDASTSPAATKYQGVWHEQLARFFLGLTPAKASLDGGTDYAFGSAETLDGKRSIAVAPGANVQIDNMGLQVTNYLTGHPGDPAALYIVWGGGNDLFVDSSATNVTAAAQRETALVRRLAEAGARTLLVPNLPPLGQIPAYSGNASQSAALTQAAADFRDQLNADLDAVQSVLTAEGWTVKIYRLDIFGLFSNLISGGAAAYGFTDVTTSAQGRSVPADASLFWDSIHPTTAGHYQIAAQAYTLLAEVPVVSVSVRLEAAAGATSEQQGRVTLTGIPGRTYRLQSSDDLVNWTPRASLNPDVTSRQVDFIDPPPLTTRRFYRALQP